MSKTRTVSEKGRKKMDQIAKAAAQVFNKVGYLEATLDDIAAAVKMSKGALYHYFDSKDDILFFILDNYMDLVLEHLEPVLLELDPGEPKIRYIIERHLMLYARYKAESKTLLHDSNCLPPQYRKRINSKEREYLRLVKNAIAEVTSDKGEMKKEEITALAFLLFGMCNWCYNWYDPHGPIDVTSLSEIIFRVFIRGISAYPEGGIVAIPVWKAPSPE